MKYKIDTKSIKKETKVETFISSGPGGQRRDKKQTVVRLYHHPSGIAIKAEDTPFQARNKKIAFERLREALKRENRPQKTRIPTKVSFGQKLKRLEEKKKHSEKKEFRRARSA